MFVTHDNHCGLHDVNRVCGVSLIAYMVEECVQSSVCGGCADMEGIGKGCTDGWC